MHETGTSLPDWNEALEAKYGVNGHRRQQPDFDKLLSGYSVWYHETLSTKSSVLTQIPRR